LVSKEQYVARGKLGKCQENVPKKKKKTSGENGECCEAFEF